MKKNNSLKQLLLVLLILSGVTAAVICTSYTYISGASKKNFEPENLSENDVSLLNSILDAKYPRRSSRQLSELPYGIIPAEITLNSESAILVDTLTGSILYEKNADIKIPPASMTKIIEMYVVLKAVSEKRISLDDIVPLPKESWAENIPHDATRMHLEKKQTVTLRELLVGLAVASGNDASIAVAHYVSGTMENFVEQMNKCVKDMGLKNTHFVESSGYSEENITTARDFATFARIYINQFPYALQEFHAQSELIYPKEFNLSREMKSYGDSLAIRQPNTNLLLKTYEGCDGLKTGFIDESGYNISVTAQRNGTRFLSVTMRGPGKNIQEGNNVRVKDNTALLDFAFNCFADYEGLKPEEAKMFSVQNFGTQEKAIKLVPAFSTAFTVPAISGTSPSECAKNITHKAEYDENIFGSVQAGTELGKIIFYSGTTPLYTVPLVADRTTTDLSGTRQLFEKLIFRRKLKDSVPKE